MMKVLSVDNLITRNLNYLAKILSVCDQVVYRENLHYFMNTGATEKSLQSLLLLSFIPVTRS